MSKKNYLKFLIPALLVAFTIGAGLYYFYFVNYEKTLPDNSKASGWIDMSSNVVLFHFDKNKRFKEFIDKSEKGNNASCPSREKCPKLTSEGKIKGSLEFDGEDDYLNFKKKIGYGKENLTAVAWVKPKDLSKQRAIFGEYDADFVNGFIFSITGNNQIKFFDGRSNNYTNENLVKEDEWQHIAVTYNGNENKTLIYYNGNKIKQFSAVGSLNEGNITTLGSCNIEKESCLFDGKMDEVALFDKSLSESQINKIYNRQK